MLFPILSAAALLLASLPLGDDTPITLYVIIAVVAVILIVVSVLLGKKSKK